MPAYDALLARSARLDTGLDAPVRPGPGKFEANYDRTLATALYDLSLDGSLDEETGNVAEHGWVGRIGQFLLFEDSGGFFEYEDAGSESAAKLRFSQLEEDMYA